MLINLFFLQDDYEELHLHGQVLDSPTVAVCEYLQVCDALPRWLDPSIIYIIDAERLPTRHPLLDDGANPTAKEQRRGTARPSILCHGKPADAWLEGNANILYSESGTTLNELINAASDSFARYARWEASLNEVIARDLPLEELAARSVELFGNPIYAESSAYHALFYVLPKNPAHTEKFDSFLEDLYNPMMKTGKPVLDDDTILSLMANPELIEADTVIAASKYRENPFGFEELFYNCRDNGMLIARILVDEVVRPLKMRDYALLSILGDYLTQALMKSQINEFSLLKGYSDVMYQLLMHQPVPWERIESMLAALGWDAHDEYLSFNLASVAETGSTLNTLPQLSVNLSLAHTHMFFIPLGDRSAFICNLTKMGCTRSELISMLAPTLRDYLVKGSFSASFNDLANLHYYHEQASLVEQTGTRIDPTSWIYRFENYVLEMALDRCVEGTIPEAFVPIGLGNLIAYDNRKGTNFVELLRIYLDNERNIAQTARKAFLHRNTCIYKLRRINEITGLNLENSDNRIMLQLVLRMIDRTGQ